MNSDLIASLERPLYLENPRAWSPDENAPLLAVLAPSETSEIQSLEAYQQLLVLRLQAMVKEHEEHEEDQLPPWQEMVQAKCSHLYREIPLTPEMNDEEILQTLAQSVLVQIRVVAETGFPIPLLPVSTKSEDRAISNAVETTLAEWLIWLTR